MAGIEESSWRRPLAIEVNLNVASEVCALVEGSVILSEAKNPCIFPRDRKSKYRDASLRS
jgi:hypothetical protein